ncbi:DUF4148 domain-containing protein [Acidovorax sp. SUPP3334]|uniref:DUF4148 domain-containing protein n=1 Tax=Acidovorax sp. SUPP3334 TaxID=2920881 RepID=UPI0023DE51F2|nr:DUF4148 domain-containing protein [Acidovorax sp. SUPP3334]GKT22317.1 DUF4148 domain-containing protein [Acidovorax sp. SUPP3334]
MTRSPAVFLLAAMSAALLPLGASASNTIHSAPTESGYTVHPQHAAEATPRAQVLSELNTARKDGTLVAMQWGLVAPAQEAAKSTITREQVREEAARAAKGNLLRYGDH